MVSVTFFNNNIIELSFGRFLVNASIKLNCIECGRLNALVVLTGMRSWFERYFNCTKLLDFSFILTKFFPQVNRKFSVVQTNK